MSHHPLAGVIEKLRRSDAHLILLYHKITAYVRGAPFMLTAERDSDGNGLFIFQVLREPPMEFATIVGDVVHNVRSALDYLAHEAIKRNGFPPANPKRIQFPICGTVRDFDNEAINLGRLCGISHFGYRIVDAFQPHQMRPPFTFEVHPLWHLHKLSNLDKHQTLNLSSLGTYCRWRYLTQDDRLLGEDVRDGMMYNGAVIGLMPAEFINEKAKIEAQITGQVSFRDAPVVDRDVMAVLQSIREFVGETILPAFERLFDPLPDDLRLTSHGIPPEMRPDDTSLRKQT